MLPVCHVLVLLRAAGALPSLLCAAALLVFCSQLVCCTHACPAAHLVHPVGVEHTQASALAAHALLCKVAVVAVGLQLCDTLVNGLAVHNALRSSSSSTMNNTRQQRIRQCAECCCMCCVHIRITKSHDSVRPSAPIVCAHDCVVHMQHCWARPWCPGCCPDFGVAAQSDSTG